MITVFNWTAPSLRGCQIAKSTKDQKYSLREQRDHNGEHLKDLSQIWSLNRLVNVSRCVDLLWTNAIASVLSLMKKFQFPAPSERNHGLTYMFRHTLRRVQQWHYLPYKYANHTGSDVFSCSILRVITAGAAYFDNEMETLHYNLEECYTDFVQI